LVWLDDQILEAAQPGSSGSVLHLSVIPDHTAVRFVASPTGPFNAVVVPHGQELLVSDIDAERVPQLGEGLSVWYA
jgi:hypothetical protein